MSHNYVDFLIEEYIRRKSVNGRYSERAFAKFLGLSPGFLKLLFQRKKRLSLERAHEISARIGWSELKREAFCQSVAGLHGGKGRPKTLPEKDFFEISDWFHFAALEYLKLRGGSVTSLELAEALGVSATEIGFALRRLQERNLIQVNPDGKFRIPRHYEVPSVSSAAIRKYHRQTLELALAAIENQEFSERDLRGLTLTFDSERMVEAQKFIASFVMAFNRRFGVGRADSVYQLNTAFFKVTKGEK